MKRHPLFPARPFVTPAVLALALFGSSCADLNHADASHAASHAASQGAGSHTTPPPVSADKPAHLDGLHNVVTYGPDMICGGVPEGEEGLHTLAAMGVKTIVSVDGATPDVATAEKLGMRYVHLPISYNGVPEERQKELAQAITNLPGPVYMHCHHGKHRSASALGSAMVLAGKLTPAQAEERMKVSGTSQDYQGLWQAVRGAQALPAAELKTDASKFPSIARVSGMVASMSEIDLVFDNVKAAKTAAWGVPKDHPDLVPTKETRRLAQIFAQFAKDPESLSHPADYQAILTKSVEATKALDAALRAGDLDAATKQFDVIGKSCKECHKLYRDN